jgi:threonine dehydrogenase-like Zn-dependent dehydrogenase
VGLDTQDINIEWTQAGKQIAMDRAKTWPPKDGIVLAVNPVDEILRLTGGPGVDSAIECLGGQAPLKLASRPLAQAEPFR